MAVMLKSDQSYAKESTSKLQPGKAYRTTGCCVNWVSFFARNCSFEPPPLMSPLRRGHWLWENKPSNSSWWGRLLSSRLSLRCKTSTFSSSRSGHALDAWYLVESFSFTLVFTDNKRDKHSSRVWFFGYVGQRTISYLTSPQRHCQKGLS